MWQKFLKISGPLALALVLVLGTFAVLSQLEAKTIPSRFSAAEFSVPVYMEPGGAKLVAASGGEIEVQSGGTLDLIGTMNNSGGTLTLADNVDVTGTLQYGSNNLYPVGYASSGQQLVYGSSSITTTATAAHGLTTVTWAQCTLAEDPGTGAGDAAVCSVTVVANTVTLKVWQDDFSAATEADVAVNWLVIGTP